MRAERIMQSFLGNVLDETVKDIQDNARKNQAVILQEIIKPMIPSSKLVQFANGTLQNIVATFIFSLLIAFLIVFMQMRNNGLKEVVESIFDVKIESKTEK